MKALLLKSPFIACLFNLGVAHAEISVIVTPLSTAAIGDVETIRHSPLVIASESVFSQSEMAAFVELGDARLSASAKITIKDTAALNELNSFAARHHFNVDISKAAIPIRLEFEDEDFREPLFHEQWGLANSGNNQWTPIDDISSIELTGKAGQDIGLLRTPKDPAESKPVIVAVLDTGVDYNHPDLVNKIVRKDPECKALDDYKSCLKTQPKPACDKQFANFDSDKNGYPLDCSGWNVTVGKNPLNGIQGNGNANDDNGHGTHVSGVIAAMRNSIGILGVSQNAKILPVKVISTAPKAPVRPQADEDPVPSPSENGVKWDTGFADVIARGLLYAIRSGAQVVNMSLAWPSGADTELMRSMIALAQKRGVLVVAAAGNDSTEAIVFPCYYEGVICVAAHGPDGTLTRFSNHGSGVDLAAPGINILSTWPMALRPGRFTDFLGYEFKNGTSMASPFVAGVVAEVLSRGANPEEAYSRTLLGSRPRPFSPNQFSTRFGNLDLAGALAVPPQALILPEKKTPLRLNWNRQLSALPIAIPLKNFWAATTDVSVSVALNDSSEASLTTQNAFFETWNAGETKTLEPTLVISDPLRTQLNSEIALLINITAANGASSQFVTKIQLFTLVSANSTDPDFLTYPITGGRVPQNSTIRTVLYTGENALAPPRDYVAITKGAKSWNLTLLNQTSEGAYSALTSRSIDVPKGDLLSLHRLDWNLDGKEEYVFIYSLPHPQGKKNAAFLLDYLDERLNSVKKIEYVSDAAMMPETFQWLATRGTMTPAWITVGFTPPNEQSTVFNPWKPKMKDSPILRAYYIASDGLRSVTFPKNLSPIALLSQDYSSAPVGTLQVLVAEGSSYELKYYRAEIRQGTKGPEVFDAASLSLPKYRMLVGVDTMIPVTSLSNSRLNFGTAFGSPGSKGTVRTTAISGASATWDETQRPVLNGDVVLRLAGAFESESQKAVFTQTQYNLQFHNMLTGETAVTSLRRFSFLPQLAFLRSFMPAVVQSTSSTRTPAILVFGDLSGSESTEVIVPVYGSDGTIKGLQSPARLKLEAGEGCRRVGNPMDADGNSPTRIVFFCGDRMIAVPMNF